LLAAADVDHSPELLASKLAAASFRAAGGPSAEGGSLLGAGSWLGYASSSESWNGSEGARGFGIYTGAGEADLNIGFEAGCSA